MSSLYLHDLICVVGSGGGLQMRRPWKEIGET